MQADPWKRGWLPFLLLAVAYFLLSYSVQRYEHELLFGLFAIVFAVYGFLVRDTGSLSWKFWITAAIALRLIFLFSTPALSDDVYRFLWDGRMLVNGLNPFEFLPEQVLGKYPGLNNELYSLLNSQGRPTIYPPLSQVIFLISAYVGQESIWGSIVTMRTILLLGEAGTILLMLRLLRSYGMSRNLVFLYALNPLVILEISGNLHYEGLMLFFMLLAVALLGKKKNSLSAISWGLAVGVKLMPLIFLPLFIRRLGWKKSILYGCITLITAGLVFAPLVSWEFLKTMKDAVGLYFVKFEFNASIYYLLREAGFLYKGWNMIATIGPRLGMAAFLGIIFYAYLDHKRKWSFSAGITWTLFIYLALAMIVHPWYILPMVGFAVFSGLRWPLVWSGLILLSYEGYRMDGYVENYWLIGLEYLLLAGFIIWEYRMSPHSKEEHVH